MNPRHGIRSKYTVVTGQDQNGDESQGWEMNEMAGPAGVRRRQHSEEEESRDFEGGQEGLLGKGGESTEYSETSDLKPSKISAILGKIVPEFLKQKHKTKGWRAGIHYCIALVSVCFLINLILTIVAAATHSNNTLTSIGTLYSRSCTKVSRINSVIHIFINILSTALLGGSNYVMQILGAPTREQIDSAHARGRSLDIGIPSWRNMRRVGWMRALLFVGLWSSSFPLHFFWNSVVFSTLDANQFVAITVASDFETQPFNCDSRYMTWTDAASNQRRGSVPCSAAESFFDDATTLSTWERLENKDCMEKNSASFLSGRRNFLIVSNMTKAQFSNIYNSNSSAFGALNSTSWNQRIADSTDWLGDGWLCKHAGDDFLNEAIGSGKSCSDDSSATSAIISHAQNWQIKNENGTFPVQYCLSEVVPEQCKVQSLLVLLLGVTCMNLIKLTCMVLGVYLINDRPFMVLGDAAASFLQVPDLQTVGRCLWTGQDFKVSSWRRMGECFGMRKRYLEPEAKVWDGKQRRWSGATPSENWFWYLVSTFVSLFVLGGGTATSIASMNSSSKAAALSSQLGTATAASAFELWPGVSTNSADFNTLINMAMAANAPQVLFVFFYYMSNRLITCMLSADEWSRFAFKRRSLRVSYPTGKQRSTYWLQVPYRYSLPLLVISTLTHFFISESLFVLRVWIYDWQGNIVPGDGYAFGEGGPLNNTIRYNARAIITSLSFMTLIMLVVVGMGFKKFHPGLPLAGNSSLAISAACHRPVDDGDAAEAELMWGAVRNQVDEGYGMEYGHCCFTSQEVEMPVVGNLYAGS